MNRKTWAGVGIGTVLLMATAFPATAGETLCIPMGTISLGPLAGVVQQRASVAFSHASHFSLACRECHHTWSGEAGMKGCTTAGCHDQPASPRDSKTGEVLPGAAIQYYKKAYHQLCVGCHSQMKEKNEAVERSKKVVSTPLPRVGPTACVECHPKK